MASKEKERRRSRGRPRRGGREWHQAIRAWMRLEEARVRYRHQGARAAYYRALKEIADELGKTPDAARQWIRRSLKSAPVELREALPPSTELVWVPEGSYMADRRAVDSSRSSRTT